MPPNGKRSPPFHAWCLLLLGWLWDRNTCGLEWLFQIRLMANFAIESVEEINQSPAIGGVYYGDSAACYHKGLSIMRIIFLRLCKMHHSIVISHTMFLCI